MNYEIECDNCGSHKVKKIMAVQPEPPKIPVLKMSEVVAGNAPVPKTTFNAVMTYSTYKLHCDNCGYETEPFTENNQLGTIVSPLSIPSASYPERPLQVNPKSHHYEQ